MQDRAVGCLSRNVSKMFNQFFSLRSSSYNRSNWGVECAPEIPTQCRFIGLEKAVYRFKTCG